jgi:hypothetical protein
MAVQGTRETKEASVRRSRAWYWLLVVPLVGTLIPSIYNRSEPELAGIPFFYWYQMAWIPLGVACTLIVYLKTRRSGR